MYKIINIGILKYLTDLIPKHEIDYNIRNGNKPLFNCRTESLKTLFFPYTIEARYSLDPTIIISKSLEVFKSKSLAFIQPVQRSIYSVFSPQGLKFLTRLRLGMSHLKKQRFRQRLNNCINPLCSCSLEVENTLHFFLHCLNYSTFRTGLMNKVNQMDENFSHLCDDSKISLLLHSDLRFDCKKNNFVLSASINYILKTERFSSSVF